MIVAGDEQRILIVEDDCDLSNITMIHLTGAGYAADAAHSLAEAERMLDLRLYMLILLDIMLPDGEGYALCQTIRRRCSCPIIFISCLRDGDSIVAALRGGGDDYMTKPVNYRELLARVEANIRRATVYGAQNPNDNIVRFRRFSLDKRLHRVWRDGCDIDLTPIEYALLMHLYANNGELILYNDLYSSIWGMDGADDLRTLTVHVSNLRKKIDPDHAGIITTVRNAGYIFTDA
ncbi:MAG: response regulator transcription factor [Gracilibacteraceae bacterium]|nr:response regulator transcription factor [Gracilibacteraceae bacterium]